MFDDSGWKQLTPHQMLRTVSMSPNVTLGEALEVVKSFGDPFKHKGSSYTKITTTIDECKQLRVHAMLYKDC
jgi:hypothetical protein